MPDPKPPRSDRYLDALIFYARHEEGPFLAWRHGGQDRPGEDVERDYDIVTAWMETQLAREKARALLEATDV